MRFRSTEVQQCAEVFQTVSFRDAHLRLDALLCQEIPGDVEIEAMALSLRIQIERYEPSQMESLHASALQVLDAAMKGGLVCATYHLGIVFIVCADIDSAEICFQFCLRHAQDEEEMNYAKYGIAAVYDNRKQSETALSVLIGLDLESSGNEDFRCLASLLRANCLRGLGRYEEALAACQSAQKRLPLVKTFYLKNWVFFGLGAIHARCGDVIRASTLFESVVAITHPTDLGRIRKLALDELARLEMKVEALFDPNTGDIISNRGFLSLRRKPTLIGILKALVEKSPESLSKEGLYQEVWGGLYHPLRHDSLIYSHIQRLRQILGADAKLKDLILTTQEGYTLNPEIQFKFKKSAVLNPTHSQLLEAHHEN